MKIREYKAAGVRAPADKAWVSILAAFAVGLASIRAVADINPGLLSDFETGTTQGWAGRALPTPIPSGGPDGVGDGFLRIGGGVHMATRNSTAGFTGPVNPRADWIEVDMMRPSSDVGSLSIRLVLFQTPTNPNTLWTSTIAAVVPNDGQWRTYVFSLAEADLTRVQGSGSYAALLGQVSIMMLRYDPGTPSATGLGVSGTLGIDNVTVVDGDFVFGDGFESAD